MDMVVMKGRPAKYGSAMRKTSIMLPDMLVEALGQDAKKSGFKHWSEQARCELMSPRGMWKEIKPYLPTQGAPGKA
jgi:hypothetical protein